MYVSFVHFNFLRAESDCIRLVSFKFFFHQRLRVTIPVAGERRAKLGKKRLPAKHYW
jgi:hypothetical protein